MRPFPVQAAMYGEAVSLRIVGRTLHDHGNSESGLDVERWYACHAST